MFDLTGGTNNKRIVDVAVSGATNHLALVMLLLEKGIIEEGEIEKATVRATQLMDQEVAKRTEEANREFDEKYPNVRKVFGKLFGDDSES